MINLKRLVLTFLLFFVFINAQAETKKFNMVFVPASEKGDESDYANLISIVEDSIEPLTDPVSFIVISETNTFPFIRPATSTLPEDLKSPSICKVSPTKERPL